MTGPERDRLDEMIEQGLGDIVPGEGVIEKVNPWRRPIGRIAAGMALTGITLNFLYLQYLLLILAGGVLLVVLDRNFSLLVLLAALALALCPAKKRK